MESSGTPDSVEESSESEELVLSRESCKAFDSSETGVASDDDESDLDSLELSDGTTHTQGW